jgi:hypothetical protein
MVVAHSYVRVVGFRVQVKVGAQTLTLILAVAGTTTWDNTTRNSNAWLEGSHYLFYVFGYGIVSHHRPLRQPPIKGQVLINNIDVTPIVRI